MNKRIVALILIVVGVVVLAYSGISFKTPGQPIDLGPIHIETTQRHFIPPAVGAVALIGGLVLMFAGGRKT